MNEMFTEGARKAIEYARDEAAWGDTPGYTGREARFRWRL